MFALDGKINKRELTQLPAKTNVLIKIKGWAATASITWAVLLFYYISPYYRHLLRPETRAVLVFMAVGYTFFGLVFYLSVPAGRLPKSRGLAIMSAFVKIATHAKSYFDNFTNTRQPKRDIFSFEEKTALLFFVVKLFFLPLMLNYVFLNYSLLTNLWSQASFASQVLTLQGFNYYIFPLVLMLFFFIDVSVYAFAYLIESRYLGNTARSVDPTFLGWTVALICYEPFNSTLYKYVSWHANEFVSTSKLYFTFTLHILVLLLFALNMLATLSLGAKAANLTNRGIVSRGPYGWIRHPAYATKNLAWWITIIPVFSIGAVASMAAWSFVYFLRSITEERHLLRDPDYQAYVRKVRYRFIPGVW